MSPEEQDGIHVAALEDDHHQNEETAPPQAPSPSQWPSLSPSDIENLNLFRRSPHPYHRRQHEMHPHHLAPDQPASTDSPSSSAQTTSLNPTPHSLTDEDDIRSARRKPPPSHSHSPSSESGTEADDEGYGFVKALPAPPLRPRKGLRVRSMKGSGAGDGTLEVEGEGESGAPSPLLTPSAVDEEGRRLAGGYFSSRGNKNGGAGNRFGLGEKGVDGSGDVATGNGGLGGVMGLGLRGDTGGVLSLTDEETKKAREKYLRRRRNELVRRTTETALLGGIGVLAVRGCGCWGGLLLWHRELLTHVLVMASVLGLYPLRLLWYSRSREPPSNRRLRQRIRIPAAFDPAPILYPTILPVLISISLFSSLEKALLPNILLGLAAIPPELIPLGRLGPGYSSIHWFISILPLAASENTELFSKISIPMPYRLKLPPAEKGLHPDTLASLFALHQALLPPLHYLTTTSLLPAELHLLSIGLINLLLFADSPQTEILKTLLWLGGVSLFVLCGKVLKWGVALARIPRWRFRRAGQVIKARQSFLQLLNDSLTSRSQSTRRAGSDSDADEDGFPALNHVANHVPKTKTLRLNVSKAKASRLANGDDCNSAVEPRFRLSNPFSNDHNNSADQKAGSPKQRRNTLPNLPSQEKEEARQPSSATRQQRQRSKSIAQSFLALTPTQAAIRKWLYAGYFYAVVILLVLLPIRHIISKHALNNHEPFGWAISYLFGNIQPLRFQILNWDLETWIPLPPLLEPSSTTASLIPYLRHHILGPATTRLLLSSYYTLILLAGLLTVTILTPYFEVDTRRKVFHGMMVAMLLPTIPIDPLFISLALALVLAAFLLLDLIRASQLPPLSKPIARFLTPYVDGRDLRGPVVISHIFLLIGCAVPLWLGLAGVARTGLPYSSPQNHVTDHEDPFQGWEVHSRDISLVSGVICVGMGDAAASLIGRRYGRRKWPWAGGKSLEGSAAFAIAVTVGLVVSKMYLFLGWEVDFWGLWGRENWGGFFGWGVKDVLEAVWRGGEVVLKAGICAMGASLNEAVLTGGNDNVVVPVVLWVLVRGVGL